MPKRLTTIEYQAKLDAKRADKLIVLEPYSNIRTPILHQCCNCGSVRRLLPWVALRSNARSLCCHQLPTTDSYIKELQAVGSTMVPTEVYRGRNKKSLHICTVCDNEKLYLPNHLIRGHGCFFCAKDKGTMKVPRKVLEVGGRTHSLQGFEVNAFNLMVSYGALPENILSSVSHGKPTIRYRFKGRVRTYIPDFYHVSKDRIIEVKSTWTFGVLKKPRQGGPFAQNVAKAKAAIEAGYKFKLLLLKPDGERYTLPDNWYEMSKSQIRRALFG